ncbi:MAG: single-stranded DNA-binding protein [Paraclostridium sp.]
MNKLTITGRLTDDMEVKTFKEFDLGNFTIANNVGYGEEQKTNFLRCTLYGKRVESLEEYLLKGVKVLLNGRLDLHTVQEGKDYKNFTTLVIEEIEILEFKKDEEEKKSKKRGRK